MGERNMTQRVSRTFREILYRSLIYNFWLGQSVPKSIRSPRSGSSRSREAAWYAEQKRTRDDITTAEISPNFRWLIPDELQSRTMAEALVSNVPKHVNWQPDTWRDHVVGERLVRWISAYEVISPQLSKEAQEEWARSILRAARHLDRIAPEPRALFKNFFVHQARIFAALALPGNAPSNAPLPESVGDRGRAAFWATEDMSSNHPPGHCLSLPS